MRECDVWRNATEPEFDNAMEGMEKLVMNQLYQQYVCCSPLDTRTLIIDKYIHPTSGNCSASTTNYHGRSGTRSCSFATDSPFRLDRREASGRSRGRRKQRLLDVRGTGFVLPFFNLFIVLKDLIELLKINHYKAPRDKLICILNCCKVIYGLSAFYDLASAVELSSGLIRHLHKDEGADSFVPILIFVVLKANPEHLLSNVEYDPLIREYT